MESSRRAILLSAAGVGGLAATAAVTSTGSAAAATGSGVAWLNVMDYGAKGDDTTDDQPAIQAAINAARQGSTVYFPPAKYRLASPITVSMGVTLRGDWAPHFPERTEMIDWYLRPAAPGEAGGGFAGSSLIILAPAANESTDGYLGSAYEGGPRLVGLALNGQQLHNAAGLPIAGIQIADTVTGSTTAGLHDVAVDTVTVWDFTGDGVHCTDANGILLREVCCSTNGGYGFNFDAPGGIDDADLIGCYAQGNGADGYYLTGPNAVHLLDCRSEFNSGYGYNVTGTCVNLTLTACNTDRSGKDGFFINTTERPPLLVNCLAKRDGSATLTTSSGFNVAGPGTNNSSGAILANCMVTVAGADGATDTSSYSPAYGISTSQATNVSVPVVSGQYLGKVAALNDTANCLAVHAGTQLGVQSAYYVGPGGADQHTLLGAAANERALQWATRGAGLRWSLAADSAAESGANAGSDLVLSRFSDTGQLVDTPLTVYRSSGKVQITGASIPMLSVTTTDTGGQITSLQGADSATAAVQAQVSGDAIHRWLVDCNGTQQFGAGGTTGRDTTWGRLGPAEIGSADSDIVAGLAGRGLKVAEGTNAKMGTLVLAGTTAVTVTTSAVAADSRIFLTIQSPGGTPAGIAYVASRTAGASFTVKGAAGDTSTVAWMIVDPA